MTLSRKFVIMLCCAITSCAFASDTAQLPGSLNWHENFEQAARASRTSGKPILAFVYVETHPPSIALTNVLMRREDVAERLRDFELFAVPYRAETHSEFLRRHNVKENIAKASDGSGEVTLYPLLPVMLYLAADETEYLRYQGYAPAPDPDVKDNEKRLKTAAGAFASHLERTARLITLLRKINEDPTPEAHAAAGHLLLEMSRYSRAQEHLDRAMALDPNNESGAFADAYLDSIIISVPDEPEQALRQLEDFHARFPDSDRLLEVQYYRGICLTALERYEEAHSVLTEVCDEAKDTPASLEPWFVPAQRLCDTLEEVVRDS